MAVLKCTVLVVSMDKRLISGRDLRQCLRKIRPILFDHIRCIFKIHTPQHGIFDIGTDHFIEIRIESPCVVSRESVNQTADSRNDQTDQGTEYQRPYDQVFGNSQSFHPCFGFPCFTILSARYHDSVQVDFSEEIVKTDKISQIDEKHLYISCPKEIPEPADSGHVAAYDHVSKYQRV